MALLIKEFRRRTNDKVSVVVGAAFADHKIDEYKKSAEELMNFLRTETYKLSPEKTKGFDKGFDFDI